MIDIGFNVLFPSDAYYVSVNLLVEISSMGQVIPTRLDVLPYKMGAYARYKEDNTGVIDGLKFVLVIYTCYAVF
jgi:hypothetical protein